MTNVTNSDYDRMKHDVAYSQFPTWLWEKQLSQSCQFFILANTSSHATIYTYMKLALPIQSTC